MNEERIDAALEAALERRAGRATSEAATDHLEPAEQAEVDSLVEIADLLWESADHEPPPLDQDPTAIMLGLVPDPAIMLDVSALKRYRQSARLKQSELAARLAARGWQIATKDVFAWETKSAAGLCPALIRAIAEELGVEAEKVMLRRDLAKETTVEKVAKTPWFVDLVWDLSRKVQITFGVAQSDLLAQMSATANRGSDLTEEQWREVLEQLVSNRTPRRSDNE